jgi:small GTP-binding protein
MKTWRKILLSSLTVLIPGVGPFVFGILICLILAHDLKSKNENLERTPLLSQSQESDKKIIRVAVCGSDNFGTGASSIVRRFVVNDYLTIWDPTMVVEYNRKLFRNDSVLLQIWSISTAPWFATLTDSYINDSQIVIFCYDLTNPNSFTAIEGILQARQAVLKEKKALILVGNKLDLADKGRQVSYQQGEEYAKNHNMFFYECSAKDGTNVDEIFSRATMVLLK